MPEETTHKRRVRYKGTHPRTFEEKYKEHDPEKYADKRDWMQHLATADTPGRCWKS